MNETLFDKIFDLDNLHSKSYTEFENRRNELYETYKNNPIFLEATKGIKTVTQSFEEISRANEGFVSYLPRLRNSKHNKKVSQIEELIEKRGSLRSNGLLYPDNALNGAIYFGTATYYLATAVVNYLVDGHVTEHSEELAWQIKAFMPPIFTLIATLGGSVICGWKRGESLAECVHQANCIDVRIKKYYENYSPDK